MENYEFEQFKIETKKLLFEALKFNSAKMISYKSKIEPMWISRFMRNTLENARYDKVYILNKFLKNNPELFKAKILDCILDDILVYDWEDCYKKCSNNNLHHYVYFIKSKNEIIYIGKTKSIKTRLFDHHYTTKLNKYNPTSVTVNCYKGKDVALAIKNIEKSFIQNYKPKGNIRWVKENLTLRVSFCKKP